MRIVRAEADDAFIVAALLLQQAREAAGAPVPGYLDRAATAWLQAGAPPTWYAEHDGAHAGLVLGSPLPQAPRPGMTPGIGPFWISELFVVPDHRRQGVGTALVRHVEGWVRGQGGTALRLHALAGSEPFLAALGYARSDSLRERRLA